MTRIDYYNDPNAPLANHVVPAASGIVVNDAGEILLQRRADSGLWTIPGGAMEPGEAIRETVIREVKEETGVDVEPYAIVGVYSDPLHVVQYSDGEVRQEFSLCFACRLLGGTPTPGEESTAVIFAAPTALAAFDIHPSIRRRLSDYLRGCRAVIA